MIITYILEGAAAAYGYLWLSTAAHEIGHFIAGRLLQGMTPQLVRIGASPEVNLVWRDTTIIVGAYPFSGAIG